MRQPILGLLPTVDGHMPDAKMVEVARHVVTRALADISRQDISSSTSPPRADLPELLRCCLMLLPLVEWGDQSLAARGCCHLFASLGAILSRGASPAFRPALEVFAEGLVFSGQLRRCFAMADSAAPEGSRVFAEALPCWGEPHVLLELVCCHFISSMQDEGGLELFFSSLSWSGKASGGTPETSFQGALALLHRACSFSLPALLEAHLFLHTSRCISAGDLDSNFLAFQSALNLYVRYLPALRVFNRNGGMKTPPNFWAKEGPFGCFIKDVTDQKLRTQINRLLFFFQLHSSDDLPTDESDIVGLSDRLIEENQHMLPEMSRQKATVAVKGILSKLMCCAKQKEMHESDAKASEETICLAAVLRVMGSSLSHIVHRFSQIRTASDKGDASYVALRNELNVICGIISVLGQHEANELHTYDLIGIFGKPVDRERTSILMLAHFASLSIFCVRRRLGFLWKSCIGMIMMAFNLMIVEEESLGISQLPIDVSNVGMSQLRIEAPDVGISQYPIDVLGDVPYTQEDNIKVYSRSTKEIALRYKNIRKVYNLDNGGHDSEDGSSSGVEGADGQAFCRAHPEYRPNSSEWDDIFDYFDCSRDKDYSISLKQRKKFTNFRNKKWIGVKESASRPQKYIMRREMPRINFW